MTNGRAPSRPPGLSLGREAARLLRQDGDPARLAPRPQLTEQHCSGRDRYFPRFGAFFKLGSKLKRPARLRDRGRNPTIPPARAAAPAVNHISPEVRL
jgi:hypothetical protein